MASPCFHGPAGCLVAPVHNYCCSPRVIARYHAFFCKLPLLYNQAYKLLQPGSTALASVAHTRVLYDTLGKQPFPSLLLYYQLFQKQTLLVAFLLTVCSLWFFSCYISITFFNEPQGQRAFLVFYYIIASNIIRVRSFHVFHFVVYIFKII